MLSGEIVSKRSDGNGKILSPPRDARGTCVRELIGELNDSVSRMTRKLEGSEYTKMQIK